MTAFNIVIKLVTIVFAILLAALYLSSSDSDANFTLVKVTDPDALCLDGSQAAYYISNQGDPTKIYLQFEGGGWCTGVNSVDETIQDCYQRSKTTLGSSNEYSETVKFSDGVLSNHQQNNFRNWTRVLIKYCDGSGHQGTKRDPISHKETNLYFRGHNVTVAQLNSLEKQNKLFSEATHVVVGGQSAGGLAVFLWTNYIKDRVKKGKVWAIPDSGVFLDSQNALTGRHDYRSTFKNLMSITNVQIAPPVPECALKFKGEIENCMFANNLAPFIKTPMFVLQSLYDTWSVYYILGVHCIQGTSLAYCTQNQRDIVQEYHRNSTNAVLKMASDIKHGFFAPVCANHVYSRDSAYYSLNYCIPQNSPWSIAKSVQSWMNNADSESYRHIDMGKWPDNLPCAGKLNPSLQKFFYP